MGKPIISSVSFPPGMSSATSPMRMPPKRSPDDVLDCRPLQHKSTLPESCGDKAAAEHADRDHGARDGDRNDRSNRCRDREPGRKKRQDCQQCDGEKHRPKRQGSTYRRLIRKQAKQRFNIEHPKMARNVNPKSM